MKAFQLCGREDKAMEAFYDGEVETIDHVVLGVALQCLSKLKGVEAAEALLWSSKRLEWVRKWGPCTRMFYCTGP